MPPVDTSVERASTAIVPSRFRPRDNQAAPRGGAADGIDPPRGLRCDAAVVAAAADAEARLQGALEGRVAPSRRIIPIPPSSRCVPTNPMDSPRVDIRRKSRNPSACVAACGPPFAFSPSSARPLPSPALEEWFTQAMHAQAAPAACRVVAHLAYACRAQTLACPSLSCDCWQIINTPGHCQTMVWRRQTPRREDRPHPPCGPVLPQDVP